MTGTATYATDEAFATRARDRLDEIASSVSVMDAAQRDVVGKLVGLWPTSGWRAAGARSAKAWLRTYTGQSATEAARLQSIAQLCSRNEAVRDATVSGTFPLGWAEKLARVVTEERARFFTDAFADALLAQIDGGILEETFEDILRWWKDQVDQEIAPRTVNPHTAVICQSLFGGGELHAFLAPVAFEALKSAMDAFRQDPDGPDAPIRRSYGERSADALEDLARFGLAHTDCDDDVDNDPDDIYNGTCPRDEFDELLDLEDDWNRPDTSWRPFDTSGDGSDMTSNETDTDTGPFDNDGHDHDEAHRGAGYGPRQMEALRRRIRNQVNQQERRRQRRVQPRSGARINMHVDPHTAAGARELEDLDGLIMRGEGWNLARSALEQFMCDSAMVTTLMSGRRVLDANSDTELFSPRQRRAIAARDRHCVFPACTRPPIHCDAHHLVERENNGPTVVENGCLLCRYHHRLLHQHRWSLYQNDAGDWVAVDPHGHAWKEPRPSDPEAP